MATIDQTRRDAIESLRRCCAPAGLKASGHPIGHHQVWARDSMIALLGARFAEDPEIDGSLAASIALLRDRRGPGGAIPNNVDCATLKPNFRAYADGGLWWIVGCALMNPDRDAIREVLHWYEYQDVDQTGLLSMQESSDWQDLFCTRGKGLYLNCLYVLALRCASTLFDDNESEMLRRRAAWVADRINTFFWYRGDGNTLRHISHSFSTEGVPELDSLGRPRWRPRKLFLIDEHYYLPYLGFRSLGEWFDSFGNLLAILSGVADREQSAVLLDFISKHSMNRWPVQSLSPAVCPGDPDWRDYYGALNTPHHYHNGGIWPFLGGFYIAALVHCGRLDDASATLENLSGLNQRGGFNEWHHGETGVAMGAQDQAWSAGMYLFAWECVKRGKLALP